VPVRTQPIDSEAAGFESFGRRIRTIEETQTERALPPGYHFNIVAGQLVIVRESDGATSTLDFT
jgi:hypothetical protein